MISGRRAQKSEERSLKGGGNRPTSPADVVAAVSLCNQPRTSLYWLDKRLRVPSLKYVMLGVTMAALVCGFAERSNHSAIYIQDKIIREEGTITNEITKTPAFPHMAWNPKSESYNGPHGC